MVYGLLLVSDKQNEWSASVVSPPFPVCNVGVGVGQSPPQFGLFVKLNVIRFPKLFLSNLDLMLVTLFGHHFENLGHRLLKGSHQ